MLGALGIVYGDIGTSPLYTEQVIFGSYRATAHVTPAGVYGVVSLIFWALMVVVSIKYAGFIMRAHNRGDGGIMALTALLQRNRVAHGGALVMLGIFGAALFFGDGIITPAISVLGSIQGLKVATAGTLAPRRAAVGRDPGRPVRPAAIRVGHDRLAVRSGHHRLVRRDRADRPQGGRQGPGRAPGAVADLGRCGSWSTTARPATWCSAASCWRSPAPRRCTPTGATSARRPIRLGWFALAFPALMLNYLGQAAMILHRPSPAENPFFLMAPSWAAYPMLFLATAATIIASQAAISGSFSVARQAVQLGFLPRLKILHTSKTEGQIYVPIVNWGAVHRRGRPHARVPLSRQARRHLRRGRDRDVHPQHSAVRRRRAAALGHPQAPDPAGRSAVPHRRDDDEEQRCHRQDPALGGSPEQPSATQSSKSSVLRMKVRSRQRRRCRRACRLTETRA